MTLQDLHDFLKGLHFYEDQINEVFKAFDLTGDKAIGCNRDLT